MRDVYNAIEVNNITKTYKTNSNRGNQIKDFVVYHSFQKSKKHEVLKGISFDVKKGETIGLVGNNGCGKSTTLKILTRILKPNSGSIEMIGRVASIIELGAGFHPDLTGRENIYINASIFGLKNKEIERRLDSIIRFSELEEFIDSPVRTYSSGMYARLAFSVAISVDAEILLVDEILSVGDAAFQTKCFNRMKELQELGVTIVIVSHSMGQIQQICDRVIWLENGLIREDGMPKEVCRHYLDETDRTRLERKRKEIEEEKNEERKATPEEEKGIAVKHKKELSLDNIEQFGPDVEQSGSGKIRITSLKLLNAESQLCKEFEIQDKLCVEIGFMTEEQELKGNFSVSITKDDWTFCYETFAIRRRKNYPSLKRQGTAYVQIDSLNLLEGRYLLSAKALDDKNEISDFLAQAINFKVLEQKAEIAEAGISSMPHRWEIK